MCAVECVLHLPRRAVLSAARAEEATVLAVATEEATVLSAADLSAEEFSGCFQWLVSKRPPCFQWLGIVVSGLLRTSCIRRDSRSSASATSLERAVHGVVSSPSFHLTGSSATAPPPPPYPSPYPRRILAPLGARALATLFGVST